MMLRVVQVTHEQVIEYFKSEPLLPEMSFGDDDLKLWKEKEIITQGGNWLGIADCDKIVSLWLFDTFTNVTITSHAFMRLSLHGTGAAKEVSDCTFNYIKEHAPMIKVLLATVPDACVHVIKGLVKLGFVESGIIENGIKWRNELMKLHILSKEVQ